MTRHGTARSKSPGKASLLLATAFLACTLGCADGSPTATLDDASRTPTTEPAEVTGSVSFELTTPAGATFDTFRYAITGPAFAKAGVIDVSSSTTISTLIEGIPEASGYSITLMGSSTSSLLVDCSGSATFAVTADTSSLALSITLSK